MTKRATGGGAHRARAVLLAWVLALAAGVATAPVTAEAAPMQLTYRVTHSTFGDIGTYTNTIEPVAGGITVQTRAHFQVKMLGVQLYNEDAQRTERWQDNRLVSFDGVTSKGGHTTTVRGEARGNSFVISTPHGIETAPAAVHPANPWSANFVNSNTMMRPDDGRLEAVRVSAGQAAIIDLDGHPIRARKYEVVGVTRYDVWLDDQGLPVKFAVDDNSGEVTFTLASCSRCDSVVGQQLGMK